MSEIHAGAKALWEDRFDVSRMVVCWENQSLRRKRQYVHDAAVVLRAALAVKP